MDARLPPAMLDRVRQLRRDATDAERLLWRLLRDRRLLGFKFRRQHPLGGHILDFCRHQTRLGVELGGGQQAEPEQAAYDGAGARFAV
jgi:adenine-specific DNA-methyltransferase